MGQYRTHEHTHACTYLGEEFKVSVHTHTHTRTHNTHTHTHTHTHTDRHTHAQRRKLYLTIFPLDCHHPNQRGRKEKGLDWTLGISPSRLREVRNVLTHWCHRAGRFRYFSIFSIKKNDFWIFNQVTLTESGLFKYEWCRNRLLTFKNMQKIIFYYRKI